MSNWAWVGLLTASNPGMTDVVKTETKKGGMSSLFSLKLLQAL